MPKNVSIRLTKEELWELICNYEKSFESGDPANAIADRVLDKLTAAYDAFEK
jgi:hypothetical protein